MKDKTKPLPVHVHDTEPPQFGGNVPLDYSDQPQTEGVSDHQPPVDLA